MGHSLKNLELPRTLRKLINLIPWWDFLLGKIVLKCLTATKGRFKI